MIRVLLAAFMLVVFAASSLQAGGLDHLKAAKTAAEAGNADEAIHLFTQALAAGDLSPADQFAARKGRGSIYTAKSMIADAFQRRDDAAGCAITPSTISPPRSAARPMTTNFTSRGRKPCT